jgi:hypothetical protein
MPRSFAAAFKVLNGRHEDQRMSGVMIAID